MTVPNSRDIYCGKVKADSDSGFTSAVIGIIICVAGVAVLCIGSFSKVNNIIALSRSSPPNTSRPEAYLQALATTPRPDSSNIDELRVLKQSIGEWDTAINDVSAKIERYRESISHFVVEM